MREILFRAKRKDNSEWVYGSLIDKDYILQYIDLAESWHGCAASSDHKLKCRGFEVIPGTVGQYMGFQDKHGNRIYEGDIIQVQRQEDTIIVECKFGTITRQMATGWLVDITGFYFEREDGAQTFPIKTNYAGKHDFELFTVIGNIHEHPQLLQEHE